MKKDYLVIAHVRIDDIDDLEARFSLRSKRPGAGVELVLYQTHRIHTVESKEVTIAPVARRQPHRAGFRRLANDSLDNARDEAADIAKENEQHFCEEIDRLQARLDSQTAELCDWRASNPSVRTPAQFEQLEKENRKARELLRLAEVVADGSGRWGLRNQICAFLDDGS